MNLNITFLVKLKEHVLVKLKLHLFRDLKERYFLWNWKYPSFVKLELHLLKLIESALF